MKNALFATILTLICFTSQGQTQTQNLNMGLHQLQFPSANGGNNRIQSYGGTYPGTWLFKSRFDNIILDAGENENNRYQILFKTGNIERARIHLNGNFGIGNPNPIEKLDVNGTIRSYKYDAHSGIQIGATNTQRPFVGFHVSDNSQRFKFELNGINTDSERIGIWSLNRGFWNPQLETVSFMANGNVGIGIANANSRLSIYGTSANGWNSGIELNRQDGGKGWIVVDSDGMKFRTPLNGDGFYFRDNDNKTSLSIKDGGNIGIGTTKPDEKLTVKGKIHAEEVRVDLAVPADYVFQHYYDGISSLKENYTMPTLEEVAAFTKKNHHLPAIPSAKEIQKEGLHLKEMTNLLLQKIEELTIYTIEQEKRIKTLESKLSAKKS